MADTRVPDEALVRRLVERAMAAAEAQPRPGDPVAIAEGRVPASSGAVSTAVAIGADHGGVGLKAVLTKHLAERGYGVTDCGTSSTDAVDYPDFAHVVARLVATGACATGIVIDGAGIGSAMAANKVPGVRAANAHDVSMARNAREHNYANVLTLGARMIGEGLAIEVVDTFLSTPWGAERHGRRVAKIAAIEDRYSRDTER